MGEFAMATLGVPLAEPPLHYVANDQYMRPILAARELLALGYRRLVAVGGHGGLGRSGGLRAKGRSQREERRRHSNRCMNPVARGFPGRHARRR